MPATVHASADGMTPSRPGIVARRRLAIARSHWLRLLGGWLLLLTESLVAAGGTAIAVSSVTGRMLERAREHCVDALPSLRPAESELRGLTPRQRHDAILPDPGALFEQRQDACYGEHTPVLWWGNNPELVALRSALLVLLSFIAYGIWMNWVWCRGHELRRTMPRLEGRIARWPTKEIVAAWVLFALVITTTDLVILFVRSSDRVMTRTYIRGIHEPNSSNFDGYDGRSASDPYFALSISLAERRRHVAEEMALMNRHATSNRVVAWLLVLVPSVAAAGALNMTRIWLRGRARVQGEERRVDAQLVSP